MRPGAALTVRWQEPPRARVAAAWSMVPQQPRQAARHNGVCPHIHTATWTEPTWPLPRVSAHGQL